MLDTSLVLPDTLHHAAIVEVFSDDHPHLGKRCRLYSGGGWLDAWTWLDLKRRPDALYRGQVTTLDVMHKTADLLLLALRESRDAPLSPMLAEDLCPIAGVVTQTARLVDSLDMAPLRRFLGDALVRRDVLHAYWSSPASRRDHHAHPGGLAEHSLEVATMVATATGLPDDDRELGIALALLHDYGKIWCYERWNRAKVDSREHEAFGLSQLRRPLDSLCADAPDLGARMEELLGGRRAPRTTPYPLAIGRIVHAFDQMSCEKTRRPPTGARVRDPR